MYMDMLPKPFRDEPIEDQSPRTSGTLRTEVEVLGAEGGTKTPEAGATSEKTICTQRTRLGQLLSDAGQSFTSIDIRLEETSSAPWAVTYRSVAPRHRDHEGASCSLRRLRGAVAGSTDRGSIKVIGQQGERVGALWITCQPALPRPGNTWLRGAATSTPVLHYTDDRWWKLRHSPSLPASYTDWHDILHQESVYAKRTPSYELW